MDVFNFVNYRDFLKEILGAGPNGGRGSHKKVAEAAGVSGAFFSQVLADQRQLSSEQAALIATHLGISDLQTEFFLLLVDIDRAGNETLRQILRKKQKQLKDSAKAISKRMSATSEVREEDKPIYYSDWTYIAVQQLAAITDSEQEISRRLHLPLKKTNEIIEFLIAAGLCVNKNGALAIGPARVHLSPDSPWIKQHHSNWRSQALESFHYVDPGRLHYSSPMTLSRKDYEKIRDFLVSAIGSISKIVDPSSSEELVCLNIDWFRIGREISADGIPPKN